MKKYLTEEVLFEEERTPWGVVRRKLPRWRVWVEDFQFLVIAAAIAAVVAAIAHFSR